MRFENGNLAARYLYGPAVDQILAEERVDAATGQTSNLYWPLADNQGSVRDIAEYDAATDETQIVESIDYSAFGKPLAAAQGQQGGGGSGGGGYGGGGSGGGGQGGGGSGGGGQGGGSSSTVDFIFGYTAREEDDDVGLMWYRARWYDGETGRFVSEDPISFSAGDTNVNRYVGNGPVNETDPSGLKEQDKKESVYDAVLIRAGAGGPNGGWLYDFYYYRAGRVVGIKREEIKFDPSKIPGARSFAGTYSIWLDPNGKRIKKPRVAWDRRRLEDLTSFNIDDLNSLGTDSLRENFKIAAEQAAALAETYYTVSVSFLPGGDLVLLANDVAEGNLGAAATDVAVGHADKLVRVAGIKIFAIVVDGETFRLAKRHIEALGGCPKERAKQLLDKATDLWRRYKSRGVTKTFDDVLDEVLTNEAPRETALFGAKWGTWRELPKVTRGGRVYANINGRLYTEHAIQRMVPKSFGNAPGGLAGRGVPSMVVEEVIQHGRIGGIRVVGSTTRVSKILGDVEVILENGIVISIIRH